VKPMHLPDVEAFPATGARGEFMARMRAQGLPIPQLQHLFAFKPRATDHLTRFTQEVMRGPSPLPAWQREMIAALTSGLNECPY
jgi:hypothetical protein